MQSIVELQRNSIELFNTEFKYKLSTVKSICKLLISLSDTEEKENRIFTPKSVVVFNNYYLVQIKDVQELIKKETSWDFFIELFE